ncbi:MAG: hypothetical protein JXB50_12295 [Spirochaetes bacterium]|nr:hypothetical protein [Spirochaetota bacterium]
MIINISSGKLILMENSGEGILLPGFVTSFRIGNNLIIEEKDKTSGSGKYKVVSGWNDSSIGIDLRLLDKVDLDLNGNAEILESCYEYLEEIESCFKKTNRDGTPVLYEISHDHANSRGIKKVLFESLESTDEPGGIICALRFIEYEPYIQRIQTQKQTKSVKTVSAKDVKNKTAKQENTLLSDLEKKRILSGGRGL